MFIFGSLVNFLQFLKKRGVFVSIVRSENLLASSTIKHIIGNQANYDKTQGYLHDYVDQL